MARGDKKQLAGPGGATAERKEITMHATSLRHVFYVDINDDGQLREVFVVKKWEDGSLSYIDISSLDVIDKGRLKKVVMSHHADKYQGWELLDMERLSNGLNGLDYFHQVTKLKRMPGSINTVFGGGLANVKPEGGKVIGSDFTDTSGGTLSSDMPQHAQ